MIKAQKIILTAIIFLLIMLAAYIFTKFVLKKDVFPSFSLNYQAISRQPILSYNIVSTYPHDDQAFTQGLIYHADYLYESTGLYSQSSLRKIDLNSGKIIQFNSIDRQYFAEGLTIINDQIYQLTWQSNKGFIYDKNTFKTLSEFYYPTQGWGLTNDGQHLILSNGSPTLYFLDPKTLVQIKTITVTDQGKKIRNLNELEYINGKIYANIWLSNLIVVISPDSGSIQAWLDIADLKQDSGVANGIAYNPANDTLLVTGKNWDRIYELQINGLP